MAFNVDEFLAERGRRTEKVPVLLRSDLIAQRNDLQREWAEAVVLDDRENRIPEAPAIRKRIDELNDQIDQSAQWFVFGEIPRYDYEKLLRQHPPKGANKDEYMWDPEGFPPALIAAASVDPKLSLDEATKLWRNLPRGEAGRLFQGALSPQLGPGDLPLASSGTGKTPNTDGSSGTADLEASPDPDS